MSQFPQADPTPVQTVVVGIPDPGACWDPFGDAFNTDLCPKVSRAISWGSIPGWGRTLLVIFFIGFAVLFLYGLLTKRFKGKDGKWLF